LPYSKVLKRHSNENQRKNSGPDIFHLFNVFRFATDAKNPTPLKQTLKQWQLYRGNKNKTAFKYLQRSVFRGREGAAGVGEYRRMQLAYHSIRRPLIPNHVTGIQTL
jgi:hypothetical protein